MSDFMKNATTEIEYAIAYELYMRTVHTTEYENANKKYPDYVNEMNAKFDAFWFKTVHIFRFGGSMNTEYSKILRESYSLPTHIQDYDDYHDLNDDFMEDDDEEGEAYAVYLHEHEHQSY
jgi:hypothetical protein